MRWLCCYSEGTGQAGETGQQESHAIQHREVPSPTPSKE